MLREPLKNRPRPTVSSKSGEPGIFTLIFLATSILILRFIRSATPIDACCTPNSSCPSSHRPRLIRCYALVNWPAGQTRAQLEPELLIVFGLPLAPVHSKSVCVSTCDEYDCRKQNRLRRFYHCCSHPAVPRRPSYRELLLM